MFTGLVSQEYISGDVHLHKNLTKKVWNKLVIVLYLYTLKQNDMTTEQTLTKLGVREFDPNQTLYVLTRTQGGLPYMCWGVKKLIRIGLTEDGYVKGILLKVNGMKWKQFVLITLNGLDYYEVRLLNDMMVVVETIDNDIMFDELVDVIDRLIES
jgi:hypothetical protein